MGWCHMKLLPSRPQAGDVSVTGPEKQSVQALFGNGFRTVQTLTATTPVVHSAISHQCEKETGKEERNNHSGDETVFGV